MADGILFSADLAANTNIDIVTVPGSESWSFKIIFTNRTGMPIAIRLALATSGSPAMSEWIEYDYPVPANTSYPVEGLMLQNTYHVVARASAVGISINGLGTRS